MNRCLDADVSVTAVALSATTCISLSICVATQLKGAEMMGRTARARQCDKISGFHSQIPTFCSNYFTLEPPALRHDMSAKKADDAALACPCSPLRPPEPFLGFACRELAVLTLLASSPASSPSFCTPRNENHKKRA